MCQRSRLEVNIRRLLTRCELMAKDDSHKDWKLEKYIFALDDMVMKLQASTNKPSKDVMTSYIKRIDFLKGVVNTAKLTNPVERAVAAQMLPKNSMTVNDAVGPNITTQIHQKTTAKYNKELRKELFYADNGPSEDGIRQRLPSHSMQDDDLNAILKFNRNIQEKIAENMLSMTGSMKEHALAASAIIKKDIGSLEKSDRLTDVNTTKLKTESLKLKEHTKSNWRCWVWLMIAFVLIVFFNMVLFMKVAKKKCELGCSELFSGIIMMIRMSTMMNTPVKSAPLPPKTTWKPGKVKVVKALYRYTAKYPDELSFEEGDVLYVYDRGTDPNWWRAKCGNRQGLIPDNYVEEQMQEIELPLHDAARRGNSSFLREYLKQGVSGTGLDAAGNTPLYWAARGGHIDCTKVLLNLSNSAINAQNKMGDTALHIATTHGHIDIINLLLEHGADITLKNNDNLTAEDMAADISIRNILQLSHKMDKVSCEYGNDDYNDESD